MTCYRRVLLVLAVLVQPLILASSLRDDPWQPDFASDFADAVSRGQFMEHYDADALQEAIDQFNMVQDARSHILDGNRPLPVGHHTVTFKDMGDSFVLQFLVTTIEHSYPVDGGEDTYRSIVFDKKTLRQLGDFEGELLGEAPNTLRVVNATKENCFGHVFDRAYSVVDVGKNQPYFSGSLPENPQDVVVSAANDNPPNIQRFTIGLTSVDDSPIQGMEDRCEASSWGRFTDFSIDLTCNLRKGTCQQKKTQGRTYEGCLPIGGCD